LFGHAGFSGFGWLLWLVGLLRLSATAAGQRNLCAFYLHVLGRSGRPRSVAAVCPSAYGREKGGSIEFDAGAACFRWHHLPVFSQRCRASCMSTVCRGRPSRI